MDDYLIGIRLALDNGVSAGLASIRADLAALDTAIAASAEGLRALTELSASAPMPVQQAMPRPALPSITEQTSAAPPMVPASISAKAQGTSPVSSPIVRIDPPPSAPLAPLQTPQPPTSSSGAISRDQPCPVPQFAAAPVINLTAPASRTTSTHQSAAAAPSNWPSAPSAPRPAPHTHTHTHPIPWRGHRRHPARNQPPTPHRPHNRPMPPAAATFISTVSVSAIGFPTTSPARPIAPAMAAPGSTPASPSHGPAPPREGSDA